MQFRETTNPAVRALQTAYAQAHKTLNDINKSIEKLDLDRQRLVDDKVTAQKNLDEVVDALEKVGGIDRL